MPTFNGARHVAEALESVLAQTYDDFELIVVDDCSSDDTWDIVQAVDDPRIARHRNEHNLGAEGNWNRVVGLARGTYVKVMGQDDVLRNDCLQAEVSILDDPAHADIDIVSSARTIIDDWGDPVGSPRGFRGASGRIDGVRAIRACVRAGSNLVGEPSAALVRASALERAGGFRGEYVIDLDMWFRLLHHSDLYFVEEPLCSFRISGASWSGRLAHAQGTQLRRLAREERERSPDTLTRTDVAVGDVRAEVMRYKRRLAYSYVKVRAGWRRRGRVADAP